MSTEDQPIPATERPAEWRMTGRLMTGARSAFRGARWFLRGVWAWLALKPGSRPRRKARQILAGLAERVMAHPRLAALSRHLLIHVPALRDRLQAGLRAERARRFSYGRDDIFLSYTASGELDLGDENEEVRELYQRLASARTRLRRESRNA